MGRAALGVTAAPPVLSPWLRVGSERASERMCPRARGDVTPATCFLPLTARIFPAPSTLSPTVLIPGNKFRAFGN